jgi:hypothetical protein
LVISTNRKARYRGFLARYAENPHAWEARLRLARLLQIRTNISGGSKIFAGSGTTSRRTRENRHGRAKAEVDFARITFFMRSLRKPTAAERERLLVLARKFSDGTSGRSSHRGVARGSGDAFRIATGNHEAVADDARASATDRP